MKTRFHVQIFYESNGGSAGYAQKEIDLSFAPAIGSEIESSAWKKARTVEHVTLNVDEGSQYVYVSLGHEEVSASSVGLQAYCYEGHGWMVSSGLQKASDEYATQHGLQPRVRTPETL